METTDYFIEAVIELDAPVDLWLFRNNFIYDPANQEWCFQGASSKGPKSLADAREWVEQICAWLQQNYPEGPAAESD